MDNLEADAVDALYIGISPIGGEFDESWRDDVRTALEDGCDVISGLHYFLSEDDEFASLAAANDCELWDVRKPDNDLAVADGVAAVVCNRVDNVLESVDRLETVNAAFSHCRGWVLEAQNGFSSRRVRPPFPDRS